MKVQGVSQILQAAQPNEELPLIKAEEIMSILSLGIKGTMRLETEETKPRKLVDMLV